MRSYAPAQRGHTGQIKKAARMLLAAKRPMIYAGGGVIQGEGSDLLDLPRAGPELPGDQYLDGPGCLPRCRPAVSGHAGYARLL